MSAHAFTEVSRAGNRKRASPGNTEQSKSVNVTGIKNCFDISHPISQRSIRLDSRYSDTWPFTGVKAELLEGGIRVPLVMRWPGHVAPGSQSEQVMISMDLLPTFLAAAGGEAAEGQFDGIDVLPQLTGTAEPIERTLFWRFKSNQQAAVRQGDWKYLRLGDKEHLFNLAEDSRERAMVQNKYPEKFAELKALWEQWNAEMLPYPEQGYSEQVKLRYPDRY